jgi:hypothetical protein
MMKMERNKTKFKYLLGIWKTLPDYPNNEDVFYEISSYLIRDGRNGGEFSDQTFKSIFGSGWENTKIKKVVDEMILSGEIYESKKGTNGKIWYKILKR